MSTPVLIALGSNLGDREAAIGEALGALESELAFAVGSAVFETEPMYVEDQPPFLNAIVLARTELGPLALLSKMKQVEHWIGREQRERNGPREIDLDLIAFGALRLFSGSGPVPSLVVPHPRAFERRFVLEPACEVAPDFILPGEGSIANLLLKCPDAPSSVVRRSDAVLSLRRN